MRFRSWNEEFKFFIYWENGYYYYIPDETRMHDDGEPYRHVIARRQNTETFDWQNAEQATGLFDKNGKEIYVGDIVKFGKRFGVIFYNKEQASFQIKPNDGDLCGVPHLNVGSLKYIEVIGNIHEGEK